MFGNTKVFEAVFTGHVAASTDEVACEVSAKPLVDFVSLEGGLVFLVPLLYEHQLKVLSKKDQQTYIFSKAIDMLDGYAKGQKLKESPDFKSGWHNIGKVITSLHLKNGPFVQVNVRDNKMPADEVSTFILGCMIDTVMPLLESDDRRNEMMLYLTYGFAKWTKYGLPGLLSTDQTWDFQNRDKMIEEGKREGWW